MGQVKVTFLYTPDEPDDDPTGMSGDEYEGLSARLMELGADNIEMAVVDDASASG